MRSRGVAQPGRASALGAEFFLKSGAFFTNATNRAMKIPRGRDRITCFSRGFVTLTLHDMKRIALALVFAAGCSSPTAPSSTNPPVVPVSALPTTPPVVPTTPAPTTPSTPSTPAPTVPAVVFPPNDSRFNLSLYRMLVHNALDGPLTSLRRFSQAPSIYLRTVDSDGRAIDPQTLNDTAIALENAAGEMTGKFGLAGIERGSGNRFNQPGWLTVRWLPQSENQQRQCGRSFVGVEGGTIDLFPYQANCGCGRFRMAPRIVRHELGHALGFWHTDNPNHLMYGGTWDIRLCDAGMTDLEKYLASVAYDRPIGSPAP